MKLTKKIIDGKDVYFENGVKKYTHSKDSRGFEVWKEYDSNGNITHFKDSEGFEMWSEYDNKSNEIYYKSSEGAEWWSDNYPKNKEVDIEPFTFNKLV